MVFRHHINIYDHFTLFFLKKKYYFYSEKWLETSRFVYVLDAFPVEKWG
jgi:hypothetical protein